MIKKILMGLGVLFIAILLALGGFLLYLKFNQPKYVPQENLQAPIEIPDTGISKYSDDISDEKPMVVLFYVDWCGYCRRFMPIYGEVAKKYSKDFNFVVVNCDYPENKKMVESFYIRSFPTLFFMDKKLEYNVPMNLAVTTDKKIMTKELDEYLKFRERIIK